MVKFNFFCYICFQANFNPYNETTFKFSYLGSRSFRKRFSEGQKRSTLDFVSNCLMNSPLLCYSWAFALFVSFPLCFPHSIIKQSRWENLKQRKKNSIFYLKLFSFTQDKVKLIYLVRLCAWYRWKLPAKTIQNEKTKLNR